MSRKFEAAPKHLPHSVVQGEIEQTCPGQLTPTVFFKDADRLSEQYVCSHCGEIYETEKILEAING